MSDIVKYESAINDLQKSQNLCNALMQNPHYKKIGIDGIYAIVEAAEFLGINPRQALGGGIYYVKGKVELSARMMNALIRAKGHSITKDSKSDDNTCILHGRRSDNGDTWTESFSMDDAKRAGLLGNIVWRQYQKDMLFARALSRLARQLYPDVIGNCYVEGEIAMSNIQSFEHVEPIIEYISKEDVLRLDDELADFTEYSKQVYSLLDRRGITLDKLTKEESDKIFARIAKLKAEKADV